MSVHEQPVSPSVIRWAIAESGFSIEDLDVELKQPVGTVRSWAKGDDRPNWTELQRLAKVLKRQVAVFFLPEPPQLALPPLGFRAPIKGKRKKPNPVELRFVREARRLQRALSWLGEGLSNTKVDIPQAGSQTPASELAGQYRTRLGISIEDQAAWPSTSVAFDQWRLAFEKVGIHVFLFSLGANSCRGFSLWDDHAPVVAANTHWNESARIFTIFHELGHLVTRSNSVCVNPGQHVHAASGDPQERWCESFAASLLVPSDALTSFLKVRFGWRAPAKLETLDQVKIVANHFKVSIRASVLRLIEHEAATWELYSTIPAIADDKIGGGGGQGRSRSVLRQDAYGYATTDRFLQGIQRELITTYDAMSYLRVSDRDIAGWEEGRRETRGKT